MAQQCTFCNREINTNNPAALTAPQPKRKWWQFSRATIVACSICIGDAIVIAIVQKVPHGHGLIPTRAVGLDFLDGVQLADFMRMEGEDLEDIALGYVIRAVVGEARPDSLMSGTIEPDRDDDV